MCGRSDTLCPGLPHTERRDAISRTLGPPESSRTPSLAGYRSLTETVSIYPPQCRLNSFGPNRWPVQHSSRTSCKPSVRIRAKITPFQSCDRKACVTRRIPRGRDSAAHRPSAASPRVRCSTTGGSASEREVGQRSVLKGGAPNASMLPLRSQRGVLAPPVGPGRASEEEGARVEWVRLVDPAPHLPPHNERGRPNRAPGVVAPAPLAVGAAAGAATHARASAPARDALSPRPAPALGCPAARTRQADVKPAPANGGVGERAQEAERRQLRPQENRVAVEPPDPRIPHAEQPLHLPELGEGGRQGGLDGRATYK
eukprot:scaffold15394_cov111-Isochrysis_galbana.AAC.5